MNNKKELCVVLVVDDEPIIQETFKAVFNGHFKVLTAGNADEALERVAKNPVDLVFLDIHISGRDGKEILRLLKEYDKNLPVIVVTGNESEILAKELETLGACGYISKPFDVLELIALAYKTINIEKKPSQEMSTDSCLSTDS